MQFNDHSNMIGSHAWLSPSKYHWINYSDEKLEETFLNHMAIERGTQLHDLASKLIFHGVKLPKEKKTLNMYVNDAIGYKMKAEQPLVYSWNCWGTADSISFRRKMLRIHDLKTGSTPAHMEQLEIYAALFCLEYNVKPEDVSMELRIYQSDDVAVHTPDSKDIRAIMNTIRRFDERIEKLKQEA